MTTQRKVILSVFSLFTICLIVYGFSRPMTAPVSITCVGKPEPGNRQATFILTNSLAKDLTWISIIEVGGPGNWVGAAKQPDVMKGKKNKSGLPMLPAHSSYWLTVSIPEESGTWRLRCVMMREQTPLEKRLQGILNKLRLARWSWSVTTSDVPPDDA